MHISLGVALVLLALSTSIASAQVSASRFDTEPLDETTSRPVRPTPAFVRELESTAGVPPCGQARWWGRSTLDGGLASRLRPGDLPCRTIWESTIRLEVGFGAGALLGRSDGAIGGLSLGLGLRFHDYFSVYYQLHLTGGAWSREGGTSVDAAAWNAVLFEATLHRHFALALGPAIDITGECDVGRAQQADACWYAWSYGVATRVTVPLAQVDSTGIVAAFDLHVSLTDPDPRTMALLGLGFRL